MVACPVCQDRENNVGKRNGKFVILAPYGLPLFKYTDGLTRKWIVRICPLCEGSGLVIPELAAAYVLKTISGDLADALTCAQIEELRRSFTS